MSEGSPKPVELDWHQEMPHSSSQASHRNRMLVIKRGDGEPLTRADIQYDLLCHIFHDRSAVFTDPYRTLHGHPPGTKVTFRDLYLNTMLQSARCSKGLREKILEVPQFGTDFAKIALLANVGRINTTMAFFPELRTNLRTYHPIPSLQKTDGNLQDAPRIKNILKSCLLPGEVSGLSTPLDILTRARSGQIPPTTVPNLVFAMANHALPIGRTHFPQYPSLDFLDLFTNTSLTSVSRARSFLWLCYHHLEEHTIPNPFAPPLSPSNTSASPKTPIPMLAPRAPGEEHSENIDPPDEIAWGERMHEQRKLFVVKHAIGMDKETRDAAEEQLRREKASTRGRGQGRRASRKAAAAARKSVSPADTDGTAGAGGPEGTGTPTPVVSEHDTHRPPEVHRLPSSSSISQLHSHLPGPLHWQEPQVQPAAPTQQQFKLTRASAEPNLSPRPAKRRRVQPAVPAVPPMFVYHRTMLEHAWHTVCSTDPELDSDDETVADEHVRLDCMRRLGVLTRLRGREPTPEPDDRPTPNSTIPPAVRLQSGVMLQP